MPKFQIISDETALHRLDWRIGGWLGMCLHFIMITLYLWYMNKHISTPNYNIRIDTGNVIQCKSLFKLLLHILAVDLIGPFY